MTPVAPLTPAECNLQDFAFMPLDVRRLLTSETWVLGSGDERAAAMCLWLESWHQVPAASLPNSPRMLAHLAQSTKWPKVQEQALRGWIECSDGRLYHPVVAEKALEAWIEKLLNSISGASGNAKRWGIEVDTVAAKAQFLAAVGLLKTLAPRSKTLKKKAVLIIATGSPPDTPRDTPPDRKGQGQGHTVPDGTGAVAPKSAAEMTKDELWAIGKSLLFQQGTPLKQCGSIVGKLCKDYGDDVVLSALRTAVVERPADVLTFIKSICMRQTGQRSNTKPTTTDRRANTLQGLMGTNQTGEKNAEPYLDVQSRVLAETGAGAAAAEQPANI